MTPRPTLLAVLAVLEVLAVPVVAALGAGCSRAPEANAQGPRMPAPQLTPLLDELNRIAAAIPRPDAKTAKEVADLADIALGIVEADRRTKSLAERSLLEHKAAGAALEPALAHADVAVRSRAAWLAGQTGLTILQLPLLFRLKYENDPEAVVWIADALQRLGNDTGLGWLSSAMTQQGTAEAAGRIAIEICQERSVKLGEQPTYDELRRALDAMYATWLATGLGGRPGVTPPSGPELDGRLAAHLATTQSSAGSSGAVGTLPLRPIDEARYVLNRTGRLALPMLRRTLAASESYLRTMALQVLTELGPAAHDAGPDVLRLLGDRFTASYAVRALGEIGAADAIPYLRPLLDDVDSELRAASAQALGRLRDEASRPALTARMRDADEVLDVRVGAAFGLCCLGDDVEAKDYLDERVAKQDYHPSMLALLFEKLKNARR